MAEFKVFITTPAGYHLIATAGLLEGATVYNLNVIDLTPPEPFDLSWPSNNSVLNSNYVSFSWKQSYDNSGSVKYEFYINNELIANEISITSFSTTLPEGVYNWRVIAKDNKNNQRQSNQTWTVTIDTTPPKVITTYPQNGAVVGISISSIVFVFNEPMDTSVDVRSAISGTLGLLETSTITWHNNNTKLVIHPVSLQYSTSYQVILNYENAQVLLKDKAGNVLEPTMLTFVTSSKPKSQLSVSVSSLNFVALYRGEKPEPQKFIIENTGDMDSQLLWTSNINYINSTGWLNLIPSSGSIVGLGTQIVDVSVDITGLSTGTYVAEIEIIDIGDETSISRISVYLEILLPDVKFILRGQVKDEEGNFLSDVKIKLLRGNKELVKYTDEEGKFEFLDVDGYKEYVIIPQKINYEFTPSSVVVFVDKDIEDIEFIGTYILDETPQQIEIPLGTAGEVVMVETPSLSDIKIVIQEDPGKPQRYRLTVNSEKGETVAVVFRPNKKPQEYIGEKFIVKIFTLTGELIEEFYKIPQTPDDIWVKWTPKNLASGVYIVYVEGPGVRGYRKVAILR